jgi:hypothetical protein
MPPESENAGGRSRRGIPLGAVFLLALGVLLLLQTTSVVPWRVWLELWRFWPVALVSLGVNLLLGRRAPWLAGLLVVGLLVGSVGIAYARTDDAGSPLTVSRFTYPLGGLDEVDVSITFAAGVLTVRSMPEGWTRLVDATFRGRKAEATVSESGDRAELQISMEGSGIFGGALDTDWDVVLNRGPALVLELNGGAADMTLDLRELRVRFLDVNVGAADVSITMPGGAGHVDAEISAGAASIDVEIPAGVAAKITSDSGLSSIDIDERRFPKTGGANVSPDFDTAQDRIALHLGVGASSVRVR